MVYERRVGAIDGRKRVILQGLDHISIVTAASTHAVVLSWLGKTMDARIGQTPVNADVRLHLMLVGFLAALLALAPLIALLSRLFRLRLAEPRTLALTAGGDSTPAEPRVNMPRWLGLLALPLALGAGLIGLWAALPTSFWAPDKRIAQPKASPTASPTPMPIRKRPVAKWLAPAPCATMAASNASPPTKRLSAASPP